MWQQHNRSVAGSCLWIRLRSLLACWALFAPWKLDGLKFKKKKKKPFNHIESFRYITSPFLHLSLCFPPLSLSVSSSLSQQTSLLQQVSIFFKQMAGLFQHRGVHFMCVCTEAWTGPQAMPAIDFTMILIRGLPVAIDTIHQWTAQWNWLGTG